MKRVGLAAAGMAFFAIAAFQGQNTTKTSPAKVSYQQMANPFMVSKSALSSEIAAVAVSPFEENSPSIPKDSPRVVDTVKVSKAAPSISSSLPVNKVSKQVEVKKKENIKKFLGNVITTAQTDFKQTDDKRKSYSSEVELIMSYMISRNDTLGIYTGLDKQLSQARLQTYKNSKFRYGRNLYKGNFFNFTLMPALIVPTNQDSRERDHLMAAVEVNPIMGFALTDSVNFTYLPRITKNFHEYQTNEKDKVLVEYSLIQIFVLNYQMTDKFSIVPTILYVDTISYLGTERDDQFLTQVEGSYQFKKNLAFNLGVSNSGSVVDNEVGPDQNIEFVNARTSSMYASIDLVF